MKTDKQFADSVIELVQQYYDPNDIWIWSEEQLLEWIKQQFDPDHIWTLEELQEFVNG